MTNVTKDYGLKPSSPHSKEGATFPNTRFQPRNARKSLDLIRPQPQGLARANRTSTAMAGYLVPSRQFALAWRDMFSVSTVKVPKQSKGLRGDKAREVYTATRRGESFSIKPAGASNSSNEALDVTVARLNVLMELEEDDDYGVLRPTNFALKNSISLVRKVAKKLGESFSKASVSTDEEGGIRLTWSNQNADDEVRLICAAKEGEATYVYYQFGKKYGVRKNVTTTFLSSCLKRLNDERANRGESTRENVSSL